MPLFYKDTRFIFFVHIPKTGGSFIEKATKGCGWKTYLIVNGHSPEDMPFLPVSPQHFHADLYEMIFDLRTNIETFTIVRHPFTRLKSEYYWQINSGATSAPPIDWIVDVVDQYRENNSVFDNHIRPQIDFIPNTVDCQVFKFEEDGVAEALRYLKISKHPQAQMWWQKIFHNKNSKVSKYVADIERDFESQRSFIEEFYSCDMKYFGYLPV